MHSDRATITTWLHRKNLCMILYTKLYYTVIEGHEYAKEGELANLIKVSSENHAKGTSRVRCLISANGSTELLFVQLPVCKVCKHL